MLPTFLPCPNLISSGSPFLITRLALYPLPYLTITVSCCPSNSSYVSFLPLTRLLLPLFFLFIYHTFSLPFLFISFFLSFSLSPSIFRCCHFLLLPFFSHHQLLSLSPVMQVFSSSPLFLPCPFSSCHVSCLFLFSPSDFYLCHLSSPSLLC